MTHYLFKYFRIVNFGLIFICAVAGQDLSADTFRSPAIPDAIAQTSRACNEFTFDATQSTVPVSSDITYFWSFGDGSTGMDPVVTHTYYRSGDYMVNLTVTDNSGFECSSATTSKLVRANIPPRALLVSDDSACVNEPMVFDATTSYAEDSKRLRFSWDFGDGDTREGGAYHTKSYNRGGDYTARLTVDDQSMTACSTDTATKKIRINAPPIADAGNDTI
ncbi:MAG TPA: PKD domain-containing protein, partial [Candidatus Omnitrophota bacterium]|nr:PKD domain-containing protein [Candidatus Omnitrophota bacterium]